MKKTLLILVFFIGLGNVNAQSDATLDETIEWIKNYANDYAKKGLEQYQNKNIDDHQSNWVFRINSDGLSILTLYTPINEWAYSQLRDYSAINKIELHSQSKNGFKFYFITIFTKSGKLIDVNHGKTLKSKISDCKIILKDKSEAESIFNALEHFLKLQGFSTNFNNKLNLENKF